MIPFTSCSSVYRATVQRLSVYQEGSDRINIEIPGVSDANAILEELGKPGSLEFRLTRRHSRTDR